MSDIESQLYDLDRRLAEIEAHQWTANGRLRQDTAGLAFDVGTAIAVATAIWASVPFHWWYLPIAGVVIPFAKSYVVGRAWDQEQVRNGRLPK